MYKENLKKLAAITLAATMVFGGTLTAFAEGDGDTTPAAGVSEGTGSYEGGEMKYPTLSVTLPTIPAGTYDYIADPNGLIAATSNEKYADATFSGNTGIFFETSTDTYSEKSAEQKVTNENAQDIDVTVKLEQKTAGDAIIKYVDSATFADTDKENKLYLAVTDDAATNAKVAALSASGAATVTTKVAGVPGNYEAGYTAADGYGYVKKDEADLTDWEECSFILTGAVNTNATWGDNVTFPTIKVTWSYKEHVDSYLSKTTVTKGTTDTITLSLPDGVTFSSAKLQLGSANYDMSASQVSVNGATMKIVAGSSWGGGSITLTFSDGHTEVVTVV